MKTYLKWIPLAAAILGMGALFGTTYFVTHYGIVIKSPSTDAVTGHWNGTNGTITTSGTLVSAGAEVSGPVTTTSPTTNGPAANELVTAEWARTHFSGNGAFFYNSTNLAASAFDAGNTYQYIGSVPTNGSRSYTPAAGAYFGSVITTNRYQQVNGPALVQVYLTSSGGAASAQYTVHPEIYYTYDTNSATLLGDFEAADQAIIHGAITNRYDFTISFPPIVSTNANGFWIVRRFKVGTKTGTDTLKLSLGTNSTGLATSTPSSISFTQPAQAGANWVSNGTGSDVAGTASAAELYTGSFKLYRGALTPADAGISLNFGSTNRYWSLSPTGAMAFVSVGLAAGKHGNIMIDGSAIATNMAYTFPAGWRFIGYKPTYLTAGKLADIYIKPTGASDSNVVVYYGEEQ